jgi:hypothetical protein
VAIGLTAVLLRVAVFAVMTGVFGYTPAAVAGAGDGQSYERYAAAFCGDRTQWTEYDKRVFPGYPALIAAAHLVTRLSFAMSALLVTWLAAGIAAAGSAMLFQDRRVGWAMVMLIPHWPINSTLAMSEAPMLALVVVGLLLGISGMSAAAGAALGMAMTVRPVACFPLAGLLLALWLMSRRKEAIVAAMVTGLVIAGALQWVQWLTGDALHSARAYASLPGAYAGSIFAWPFQALIETPLRARPSLARIAYIWAHVLLVLGACVVLARRVRQPRADRLPAASAVELELIALVWLAGNALFTLCIGSGPFGWGFYHFPRFTIPATPAVFWAMDRVLPAPTWVWLLLAAVLFAAATLGVHEALIGTPMPAVFGN